MTPRALWLRVLAALGVCSRCRRRVAGFRRPRADRFTIGYYVVAPPAWWARFARPGERIVCDACMWVDPGYVAVYGRRSP